MFSLFQNTIEKVGAKKVKVVTNNANENVKVGDMHVHLLDFMCSSWYILDVRGYFPKKKKDPSPEGAFLTYIFFEKVIFVYIH